MADLDERTLELALFESEACVTIRVFKPSTSTSGTLFYVLRGGMNHPMSGKYLGRAKRMAALSARTLFAVHYQ